DVAGMQQRKNLPFIAVGEIRAVDQRECRWRQELALFAFTGRLFDDCRRIPLGEENLIAIQFQPPFQQVNLSGFAGAVEPFDSDKFSGGGFVSMLSHQLARSSTTTLPSNTLSNISRLFRSAHFS